MKFAIIGCGRIAKRHAELMRRHGEILAAVDTNEQRADEMAKSQHATPYYDVDDFLRGVIKVDVAAICTPNGLHAEHSIKMLRAGVHVLCEKPMAISALDCKQMIEAADLAGKHLFIVKQNRFNPPVLELKKLLEQGRLGKLFSFQINCFWNRDQSYYDDSWRGTLNLDGGTLYTQFSHFIDLAFWLLGDVKTSTAIFRNYNHKKTIEFEDTGLVLFEFMNGVAGTLNYTVNSHHKNMEGSFTLFGEKGTVKIGGEYLNNVEYQSIENYEIPSVLNIKGANDYGNYQGSMSNHEKVYENLIDFLDNGQPPYMNAWEGMKTVEIIEKIYEGAGRT